jgi:hypothetical protein
MKVTGRCYCGDIRYEASGEVLTRGMCHCRECQYIAGGSANLVMAMPADAFAYVSGSPRAFTRSDLENPATREFCGTCGTHLLTRSPRLPSAVLIKVGTLDDPSLFGMPDAAVHMADAQPYHAVPDGVPSFPRMPVRRSS